jgi:hypothetical protein
LIVDQRKNMAADGDMFVQRKAWGYNWLCAAVCDNAPTEKLAEIETPNVRNMLGNGFAVPSLKASIDQAFAILESPNTELGLESANQRSERLIESLHGIERKHIEAPSATDISKVVKAIALNCSASGQGAMSRQDFENRCVDALGDFWMRRYGWELFAPYVMRKARLSQESYRERSKAAREQAIFLNFVKSKLRSILTVNLNRKFARLCCNFYETTWLNGTISMAALL